MKTLNLLTVTTLTCLSLNAWAQSPTHDISSEITRSRDYATTMINSMGSVPANRYNETADYARIGPRLNQSMQKKLEDFRSAMNRLATSSLTSSVNEYNRIVNDSTMNAFDKKQELEIRLKVLEQQAKITSTLYAAEIYQLYTFAPELMLIDLKSGPRNKKTTEGSFILIYQDGSTQTIPNNLKGSAKNVAYQTENQVNQISDHLSGKSINDYWDGLIENFYKLRLHHFIKSNCNETRSCVGNLVGQLSEYILYVENFLNKPIKLRLADGKEIKITDLRSNSAFRYSKQLSKSIVEFQTDNTYQNLR